MTHTNQRPDPTHCLTRRSALTITAAAFVCPSSAFATQTQVRAELGKTFAAASAKGTFALFDVAADKLTLVNPERAAKRYVTASTFKIVNSLIALETGVIADENEIIPYGGKPQPFKAWEKDMRLREAIAASNVPIYQELARRIGLERYKLWLAKLNYGNQQTGSIVDRFWLDGPLAASAIEQAQFAARLAQQKLDMSQRTQSIVREILRLESKPGVRLYGKTGWLMSATPQIGWWTGWVERDGNVYAFSLNIDMTSDADAAKRLIIGKQLLAQLGVL